MAGSPFLENGEDWTDVQARTFTKWLNTKLAIQEIPPMTDLVRDLSDGTRLIQLLEIMSETSLGRYNKSPRMRVQKAENATKALDFIRSRDVRLTNIGSEDIVDGNLKLILGLIWTLILRFTISHINEAGLSAREGLLLWCQRKTVGYAPWVEVRDFRKGFGDGLALCALIHRHRPDLIDWDKLDKDDSHGNTALAFDVAAKHLGIAQLLEVSDLVDRIPDERSVITYVAEYFHAFSSMDKVETVTRRIEKFVDVLSGIDSARDDYERRAKSLIQAISSQCDVWRDSIFADDYADAKAQMTAFSEYKKTMKRSWTKERQELATMFGNIQTRQRTNGLAEYRPAAGFAPEALDQAWSLLSSAETNRSKAISSKIKQIKQALKDQYAFASNDLAERLRMCSNRVAGLSGALEIQRGTCIRVAQAVGMFKTKLANVRTLSEECEKANIDEEDFTTLTLDDLTYELELLDSSIRAKQLFIENQILADSHSNITADQLAEWQSTWQHLDSGNEGILDIWQFQSALASLGLVYSESEMEEFYVAASRKSGVLDYEAFVNLLVKITEDSSSPDQLLEAFQNLAVGQEVISDGDIRRAGLSAAAVSYLEKALPRLDPKDADDPGVAYDYRTFLSEAFVK